MRRVLKFPLGAYRETVIDTVDEPRFLAVGTQGDQVVVWAEATAGVGFQSCLVPVMTGESPPDGGIHIGTTQVDAIVVHVYQAHQVHQVHR